jgi:hypothetical protein
VACSPAFHAGRYQRLGPASNGAMSHDQIEYVMQDYIGHLEHHLSQIFDEAY